MRTPKSNIPVICLVLLMAIPMLSPLLYQMQKWEIREYMAGLLKERTLQTVSVPAEDVVWMDKHEIWVNEQMFDIVSVTIRDGIYSFTGLYDADETKVVKKQMLGGKDEAKNTKHNSLLIKWLLTACLLQNENEPHKRINDQIVYPRFTTSIYPFVTEVSSPPPREIFYHIV